MAELLLEISDVSKTYQRLRKKDPIACGEWLSQFREQGHSQVEIAQRLGANRQIIGRYLRMASWSKQLKDLISQAQISNTELLKAASSPKRELALKENIEREEQKKCEPDASIPIVAAAAEPEPEPLPSPPSDEKDIPAEKEEISKEPDIFLDQRISWGTLLRYAIEPSTFFLAISIAALSGFLIHQGILFFSAVDIDDTSALLSSLFSELIPLLSAACFALSLSRLRRILSLLLLSGSICGLAFFMQASLAQRHVDSSDQIASLVKEKEGIQQSIDILSDSARALPSNFISRKENIFRQIDIKQASLASINADIKDISAKLSGAENVSLSYGVWLRFAAMILNAMLAHALFAGLREKKSGRLQGQLI